MGNSWNFNPKDVRRDGDRNKNKRPVKPNKAEQRRQERALKTGDVSHFDDDFDDDEWEGRWIDDERRY